MERGREEAEAYSIGYYSSFFFNLQLHIRYNNIKYVYTCQSHVCHTVRVTYLPDGDAIVGAAAALGSR